MDTKTLRTEISQILETLNEQWEMVEQNKDRVPQIELDLFKETIRDLYEALLNLNRKNDEVIPVPAPPIPEVIVEPIIPEAIYQAAVPEIIPPKVVVEAPVPEFIPPKVVVEDTVPELIPPKVVVEDNVVAEKVEPPPVYKAPEPEKIPVTEPLSDFSFRPAKPEPDLFSLGGSTIADKLKAEKTTLNEKLQQEASGTTLSARLHQNPIKDLKSSIGINEKFQFINELFNGSMQEYSQGVFELNSFLNYEEALKLIEALKFKYNWDTNSDAYHKIMDFVRRRYM